MYFWSRPEEVGRVEASAPETTGRFVGVQAGGIGMGGKPDDSETAASNECD